MTQCEICGKSVKQLKIHQKTKKCMAIRFEKEKETKKEKLTCRGCNTILSNKYNLENHQTICLQYQLLCKDKQHEEELLCKDKQHEEELLCKDKQHEEELKCKDKEINCLNTWIEIDRKNFNETIQKQKNINKEDKQNFEEAKQKITTYYQKQREEMKNHYEDLLQKREKDYQSHRKIINNMAKQPKTKTINNTINNIQLVHTDFAKLIKDNMLSSDIRNGIWGVAACLMRHNYITDENGNKAARINLKDRSRKILSYIDSNGEEIIDQDAVKIAKYIQPEITPKANEEINKIYKKGKSLNEQDMRHIESIEKTKNLENEPQFSKIIVRNL